MYRVQKLLSNYGYCSRRKAEELIEQGKVKVNGKTISIGDKASEDDKIEVNGKVIEKQNKIYIMFNKPVGCVTALNDKHNKTVMDYITLKERIFPIGRLDYQTSGLLLLTNDGDFANSIMHPRYEINKTYLVELTTPIMKKHIDAIRSGVKLEDGTTSPAKVKKHDHFTIELTIHEGKNRIIRRIMEELDLKVAFLMRVKVGKLELGKLESGKCRDLTEKEKKEIFS